MKNQNWAVTREEETMRAKTMRMTSVTRTVVVATAALALVVVAGCNSGSNSGSNASNNPQSSTRNPITTTDADWKPVADALGRTGKLGDNNTAYRVALTRNDLQVTSYGVAIKPGLSLGGYAAFARYDNNETLLMGDLVVTEAEVPKVTDALQSHGISQTALHKHLLEQPRRCGGPTFTAWATPPNSRRVSRQRWMRRLSARLPRPRRSNRRLTSMWPGCSRRWAAKEHKTAAC